MKESIFMLNGKNAIITGARRGIGRSTVEVFARNGANIWACARTYDEQFEEEMAEIAEKYKVWITPVYFELSNADEIKKAVQLIVKEKKNIDILVNNAGIAQYNNFSMLSMDNLRHIYEINYIGPLLLTQLLSRRMGKDREASIVFLSSVAGVTAETGNTAYGGSKAAIAHATGVLSKELSKQNIRVNAVAPGMVETDMKELANEEYWNQLIEKTDLKRVATPEEIANAICFLSSDLSSYITGQVIRVDGGLH